jgi:hypothetical protein
MNLNSPSPDCNEKLFAKAVLVFLVYKKRLLAPTLSKGKGEKRNTPFIALL